MNLGHKLQPTHLHKVIAYTATMELKIDVHAEGRQSRISIARIRLVRGDKDAVYTGERDSGGWQSVVGSL